MGQKQKVSLTHNKATTIVANPTPEQEERLKAFDRKDRLPEIWDMGFIVPNQVTSYYCEKCNGTYKDAPKASVSVAMIGSKELNTSAAYHCSHCNELIYHGHLPSPEGIPEEFIQYDETGDYKRPTIASINSLLDRIKKQANEGLGESIDKPGYKRDLETARRWAEKINYDISPQVKTFEEVFRRGYVARLERELPTLVAEIKENAYGFDLTGFESENTSHYEGTGLAERMNQLLQTIELTTPSNPDINKDIIRIFDLYWRMGFDEKVRLLKEKKDLEERICQEESFLIEARRLQSKFIQKVNMPNEQVTEARNSPLDTWSLKD